MIGRSRKIADKLAGGIEFLFKKNKVDWLKGLAKFQDPQTVEVAGKTYTARNVVVATGSSVTPLPVTLLLAALLTLFVAAGGFGARRGGPLVSLLPCRLLLFW